MEAVLWNVFDGHSRAPCIPGCPDCNGGQDHVVRGTDFLKNPVSVGRYMEVSTKVLEIKFMEGKARRQRDGLFVATFVRVVFHGHLPVGLLQLRL